MNKVILSVTAFILSANLVNADAQDSKIDFHHSVIKEDSNVQQFDFQRWVRSEKLIGKKWIGMDGLNNKSEKEITTKQMKDSLPLNLNQYVFRIIKEKSPVTMDFSPQRINIALDGDDKILKVYIG